jgi:hypothetical protein
MLYNKDQSRQEEAIWEKSLIRPSAARVDSTAGLTHCLPVGVKQPVYIVRKGVWQGFLHQSQQPFMQMRNHICTSHRPSAGPPGEVHLLWPGGSGYRSSRVHWALRWPKVWSSCLTLSWLGQWPQEPIGSQQQAAVVVLQLPPGVCRVFKAAVL